MHAKKKLKTSFWVGAVIVAFLILLALLTPLLPLANPLAQNLSQEYASASKGHLLGLGENGVDLLSQLLWGARISLEVSLISVFFASLLGTFLGAWAGFQGGIVDDVIMRIVDVVYAFPGILLVVALAVVLGPSVKNLILALVLGSWASYARLTRALTLSLRSRDYVSAAIAMGASTPRVLAKHLLPNLLAPLIVQMSYGLGATILAESSLSFLGLGVPVGTPSWGQLLNSGREVLTSATHLVIAPGLALLSTIVGFNLLGDGLRDFFDPKLRA